MAEILEGSNIPYHDMTLKLFPTGEGQRLVPFLGAGASASYPEKREPLPGFPSEQELDEVFKTLNLGEDKATHRLFVTFGLAIAYLMAAADVRLSGETRNIVEELAKDLHPPSVGRLIELFAQLSSYSSFHESARKLVTRWPYAKQQLKQEQLIELLKAFADITDLWSDSLSSMAAYYENRSGRKPLWENLAKIFAGKRVPLEAHELIAEAAEHHLRLLGDDVEYGDIPKSHYLIVTTNYDGLMEKALEKRNLKTAVLSPKKDGTIHARFLCFTPVETAKMKKRNPAMPPKGFDLESDAPAVVLHKIHGSFDDSDDNVVISDFDYEKYIARMAENGDLMPSAATTLMHDKAFLFLGYSLSDWNIRTILTALMKRREEGEDRDYAVMTDVPPAADAYCSRRQIIVLRTTVQSFAAELKSKRSQLSISARAG